MGYPKLIPELTSLRFFAALWVVLFHFRFYLNIPIDNYTSLAQKGILGVDLFFVLSGFILSHVYLHEIASKTFDYKRFLLNRLARIYPLHSLMTGLYGVAAITAAALGISLNNFRVPLEDLPFHLLLIHGWGTLDHLSWNLPSWTISSEWFAYLLFPIFAGVLIIWKPRNALIFGVLVFVGVAVALPLLGFAPITGRTFNFSLIRIVPEFIFGITLYLFGVQFKIRGPKAIACVLVVTILALVHFRAPDWVAIVLEGGLILTLAEMSRLPGANFMASSQMVYLGEISYSVYMVHSLFGMTAFKLLALIGYAAPQQTPFAIWVIVFFLVFPVSALFYHCFEFPVRRAFYQRNKALK